jgi:hypothetical protein
VNTLLWLCFWIVMVEMAIVAIALLATVIGETSEKRQRKRFDEARREVERLRRKASGG